MLMMFCAADLAAQIQHTFDYGTRLRYSDLLAGENSGKAASWLLRASLNSEWHESFSTFVELDHVETALDDDHSDGVRFNEQPVIPDTRGSDLNQMWLAATIGSLNVRLGRQVLEFDNQRFIGSVGFWQNEQSFDALHIKADWLSASSATYTYVDNANRIFGDDADPTLDLDDAIYAATNGQRPAGRLGDHEQNTHLFRAEINEWDYSQWVTYAYFINNQDAPATSNDTLGSRYNFRYQRGGLKYRAEIEVARQERSTIAGKPRVNYSKLEAGIGVGSLDINVHSERMSTRNDVSFVTPLASLHEFHGWADKLNLAPREGLIDNSLSLKWRRSPWKFDVRYHFFSAAKDSLDYGTELDIDIHFKPKKHHLFHLRYADFRADKDARQRFSDERRVFFSYSYKL